MFTIDVSTKHGKNGSTSHKADNGQREGTHCIYAEIGQ